MGAKRRVSLARSDESRRDIGRRGASLWPAAAGQKTGTPFAKRRREVERKRKAEEKWERRRRKKEQADDPTEAAAANAAEGATAEQ